MKWLKAAAKETITGASKTIDSLDTAQVEKLIERQILGEKEPLTPLGSMFENNCMIFLDGLIVESMYRLKKGEEELRARHATIE